MKSFSNKICIWFGGIFLVFGLVAYLSNPVVGSASFFDTNNLQNFLHILTGIVFLIAAFKSQRIGLITLVVVGGVYVLLSVLGFIFSDVRILGILENNMAIKVLYALLGLIQIAFGRLEILRGE